MADSPVGDSPAVQSSSDAEDIPSAHAARLALTADLLDQGEALADLLYRLPEDGVFPSQDHQQAVFSDFLRWSAGVSPTLRHAGMVILRRRSGDPAVMINGLLAAHAAARRQSGAENVMDQETLAVALAAAAEDCLREVEFIIAAATAEPPGAFSLANSAPRLAVGLNGLAGWADLSGVDDGPRRLSAARIAAVNLICDGVAAALTTGEVARRLLAVISGDNDAKGQGEWSAPDGIIAAAESAARALGRIMMAGAMLDADRQITDITRPWRDAYQARLIRRAVAAGPIENKTARLAAVMDGLRIVEIIFDPATAQAMADTAVVATDVAP